MLTGLGLRAGADDPVNSDEDQERWLSQLSTFGTVDVRGFGSVLIGLYRGFANIPCPE
jgi:hypothetical protein